MLMLHAVGVVLTMCPAAEGTNLVAMEALELRSRLRLDMGRSAGRYVASMLRAGSPADSQPRMLRVVVREAFGPLRPTADMAGSGHQRYSLCKRLEPRIRSGSWS